MICCCSLAGTSACLGCYMRNSNISYYPTYPDIYYPKPYIKKITEKFDKDGKLIERITEEPSGDNYEWKVKYDYRTNQYIPMGSGGTA